MPSKDKCAQKARHDVFNAFLMKDVQKYCGDEEFPELAPEHEIPHRLISFSKAVSSSDHDQWVHFYEHDCRFIRVWRDPKRYLPILLRFRGIITPDFSLYRNMPMFMQKYHTGCGRVIGFAIQHRGGHVIPNIRVSDRRSLRFCCDGVPFGATIAMGAHGVIKDPDNRLFFERGVEFVVNKLSPRSIIVYGAGVRTRRIFAPYIESGIDVSFFETDIAKSRRERKARLHGQRAIR